MFKVFALVLAVYASQTHAWWWTSTTTVTYGDLGSFSNEAPFDNCNDYVPEDPSDVGVKLLLNTRQNPTTATTQTLVYNSMTSVSSSHFDPSKDTKFIIHGYSDFVTNPWVWDIASGILTKEDVNVICVDWQKGAKELIYYQACANTRIVAKTISKFLQNVKTHYAGSATPFYMSSVHVIGHSLGAQTAGHIGRNVQPADWIGRITAMDPAGPSYNKAAPEARLDIYDALYIEVLHTNGDSFWSIGFGYEKVCGDADYYINGGQEQPGCPSSIGGLIASIFSDGITSISEAAGCSHALVKPILIESIPDTAPLYTSYACDTVDKCQNGEINWSKQLKSMGYGNSKPYGMYIVNTRGYGPHNYMTAP